MRTRNHPSRRARAVGATVAAMRALAACAACATLAPRAAAAQERLVNPRTVSVGYEFETFTFGGDEGLDQRTTLSSANSTVYSARQQVVPVSLNVPVGDRWNFDLGAAFTNSGVRIARAPGAARERRTMSGLSDLRVRATGRFFEDGVMLTLGGNLPTGVNDLTPEQIDVLGVLAAPAVGSVIPAASSGPSATSGLVVTRKLGEWIWAAGASYEMRWSYAPVAALTAGLPTPTFDPGNAVHLSLGTDKFVGQGAFNLAATADIYTQDRFSTGGAANAAAVSTVQLGPTLGVEAQFRVPTTSFRELTIYAADRFRTQFERDGRKVAGSSGNYVNGGVRATYPLRRTTDVSVGVDLWSQSGLDVDNSLVTAATTSGMVGLAISQRIGGTYAITPYARYRAGTVDTGVGSANVAGMIGGVGLSARF